MPTMLERFYKYHSDNPNVYEVFKKFAFTAIRRGFKNYSSKGIFERVRWHMHMETENDEFKLNNNYTAYYARKFMEDFPEYDGFFRVRELKSIS